MPACQTPVISVLNDRFSDHLEDVIEHCYKKLRDEANQSQMVASGWIAIPEAMSLDEAHAARIFGAVGAWNQVKVNSCAA